MPTEGELGATLLKRALAGGPPDTLDAAVRHLHPAGATTSGGHVDALGWLANLGRHCVPGYRRDGDPEDLDEATGVLTRARGCPGTRPVRGRARPVAAAGAVPSPWSSPPGGWVLNPIMVH